MLSKYLYSKVKCAQTRFISLWLTPEEIHFLMQNNITFYKESEFYQVNSDELKALFCNKLTDTINEEKLY